jgi:hypothetical protein
LEKKSVSGMNIPQFVGLKILKNFDADPDPGSGINTPDPQHCLKISSVSWHRPYKNNIFLMRNWADL